MPLIAPRVATKVGRTHVFLPGWLPLCGLALILLIAFAGLGVRGRQNSGHDEPAQDPDKKNADEKETRIEQQNDINIDISSPLSAIPLPVLRSQPEFFCLTIALAKSMLYRIIPQVYSSAHEKPGAPDSVDAQTVTAGIALRVILFTLFTTSILPKFTGKRTHPVVDLTVIRLTFAVLAFLSSTVWLLQSGFLGTQLAPDLTLLPSILLGILRSLDPALSTVFALTAAKWFNYSYPRVFAIMAFVDEVGDTLAFNVWNGFQEKSVGEARGAEVGGRGVMMLAVCMIFLSDSARENEWNCSAGVF
ncbi:hypothetical protein M011DRAFT_469757 [Sporormia fimetaria CBS 119925]|uniref:Uncharacterized protein n=1 Tax=Sporormia fimetaria CBS 119925 TaxID=1340428 RepID=A0A6A6V432_9PLEO|nr:hypothetical protein M011DRAFT_469757 [Sporormia fimetaria CBS 119925]